MKKILTFTISLLLFHNFYPQTIVGKWNINFLIGSNYPPEEYELLPITGNREFGHLLNIDPDGKFYNRRIPGCGQDRNPPSFFGTYKIIDENYISFFVEKGHEEQETLINKDWGKYYYYKKGNGYNFIKSNGNLERDKQVVYYRNLLTAKDKEIASYQNLYGWIQTKSADEKEAVISCLAENQIKNFEILYSKPVENRWQTIYLIKINNEFRYIIFDKEYKRVILYDDYQIQKTDKLILEIDADKKLKTKIIKEKYNPETSSSSRNTITIYQKKDKIYKAVYNQYSSDNEGDFTVIYFEDEKPVYVEYQTKYFFGKREVLSKIGSYILDLKEHKILTKKMFSEQREIYFPTEYYERVIEEINNKLKKKKETSKN